MANLGLWLAVAGSGALHGLNPANGWMWAAAWGLRSRDRRQALRALLPIAVGHVASIGLVAGTVAFGAALDRGLLQALAGALAVVAALLHLSARTAHRLRAPAGQAGLALWSFMMATAHGAGLMLVPALIPLCVGGSAAAGTGTSGPLWLALAAVGVHSAVMLAVTGLAATGAATAWRRGVRRLGPRTDRCAKPCTTDRLPTHQ